MNSGRWDACGGFAEGEAWVTVHWRDSPCPPPGPVQQVHAVAVPEGSRLAVVVRYADGARPSMPGGRPEDGESLEQALHRELLEETNCDVLWWRHLGYQRLTWPSGATVLQARVVASIRLRGPFVADPGGGVIGYDLVPLEDLNAHLHYGDVGDRIVALAAGPLRR